MKRRLPGAALWAVLVCAIAPGDGLFAAELGAGLALSLDRRFVRLPAGRSVIDVQVPEGQLVSVGVFGPSRALRGFDVTGSDLGRLARRSGALDDDGLLPHVTSFPVAGSQEWLTVIVDAGEPVLLARSVADPEDVVPRPKKVLERGSVAPRALVGMPVPGSSEAGYMLQGPSRYHFARLDVVLVLAGAFAKTQRRFRADPIAIGDMSQWDGNRPATDQGLPRHISHVGGRDVDIALPANDGIPSTVRDHCKGVLIEEDRYGCAHGTVRGLDAMRLAYLLGLLIDSSPPHTAVTKIYIDDAYLQEVQKVLDTLRERRWIGDEGYAALSDGGIAVTSPWHTDHVHVRWAGEDAGPGFPSVLAD